MFGSARIQPRDKALAQLKKLGTPRRPPDARMENKDQRREIDRRDVALLRRGARAFAPDHGLGMTLGSQPKRFVICSGGGPGIMEAANRGAAEAGGSSIGLSIQLPHEQRPNPYITPELNFCFHYFFMRKLWFAQMAKALIVFPGGFGTMDELWEMLTLLQTKKMSSHHLILIYGRKYWHKVIDWRHMVRTGTISEAEYKMLQFADTVDEAFERVRRRWRNTTWPSTWISGPRLANDDSADSGEERSWGRIARLPPFSLALRARKCRRCVSSWRLRVRQEHGIEAPLFVPVVQQDHGRNPQRTLAVAQALISPCRSCTNPSVK